MRLEHGADVAVLGDCSEAGDFGGQARAELLHRDAEEPGNPRGDLLVQRNPAVQVAAECALSDAERSPRSLLRYPLMLRFVPVVGLDQLLEGGAFGLFPVVQYSFLAHH
ncbi:hypothetical protein D3C78_1467490 [compost metagenome]